MSRPDIGYRVADRFEQNEDPPTALIAERTERIGGAGVVRLDESGCAG